MSEARILESEPLLVRHGPVDADVLATVDGRRPSVMTGAPGWLKLDHLDSFVRSGRAHGRTRQPPARTLAATTVINGAVSTDGATADYLCRLIAGEARLHFSHANVVSNGVVRHLAGLLLENASQVTRDAIATLTDDEFWAMLVSDARTTKLATALRRDPVGWSLGAVGATGGIDFQVARLYLDFPLIAGGGWDPEPDRFGELPGLPWRRSILAPAGARSSMSIDI